MNLTNFKLGELMDENCVAVFHPRYCILPLNDTSHDFMAEGVKYCYWATAKAELGNISLDPIVFLFHL